MCHGHLELQEVSILHLGTMDILEGICAALLTLRQRNIAMQIFYVLFSMHLLCKSTSLSSLVC